MSTRCRAPAASDCRIGDLGADLMSLSAHKLGGPQGAGALIRRGDSHIAEPLIKGGGQERGQRAEPKTSRPSQASAPRPRWLPSGGRREHDRAGATAWKRHPSGDAPGGDFRGRRAAAAQYDAVRGRWHQGKTAIIAFDLNGYSGIVRSACSSGKVQASHVLGDGRGTAGLRAARANKLAGAPAKRMSKGC